MNIPYKGFHVCSEIENIRASIASGDFDIISLHCTIVLHVMRVNIVSHFTGVVVLYAMRVACHILPELMVIYFEIF